MPASEDLLFGKIAIGQRFCTQSQIDECSRLQLSGPRPGARRLGELLVERGYLSSAQHTRVLELQRQNLERVDPLVKKRKESFLFGKLAVREGLASADQVNECLRLQAREGEKRSLGELMIAQGFLTPSQVKELLGKQFKRIMSCPGCRLSFTVLTLSEGKRVDCPKCRGPLSEGKPSDSLRTDAEFATQMVRSVRAGIAVRPREEPPMDRISGPPLRAACLVCGAGFEAPLDPTGRLRCPSCHSTFTPR